MNRHAFLALALLCFIVQVNHLPAQSESSSPALQPPKCHFQILNGISPGPVDIYLDGKLIFPASAPGLRISSLGWPNAKFDLRLVDKKSGREKKQKIELSEGSYATLILAGDFEVLPDQGELKQGEPPAVRVVVEALPNNLDAKESRVRVRFMNGLIDQSVTIKSPDGKSWTVPPMGLIVASGLTDQLFLQAFLGDKSRSLYLAQPPPAKNLSIVFYPVKDAMGFRAMTETTAEAIQSDIKRTEQQEAAEKAEAEKNR